MAAFENLSKEMPAIVGGQIHIAETWRRRIQHRSSVRVQRRLCCDAATSVLLLETRVPLRHFFFANPRLEFEPAHDGFAKKEESLFERRPHGLKVLWVLAVHLAGRGRELDSVFWYPQHKDGDRRIVVVRGKPQPQDFDPYAEEQEHRKQAGQRRAAKCFRAANVGGRHFAEGTPHPFLSLPVSKIARLVLPGHQLVCTEGLVVYPMATMNEWPRASPVREHIKPNRIGV